MRPLWVWPCRHDLFGLAIARLARKSHAHKRSCLQGHAHKGLIPLETQKANSHRSIAKIHFYQAKILVGVAIKSGRGNVKGRGIYPPPPVHTFKYVHYPSNSTQKSLSYKKRHSRFKRSKNRIFFSYIRKNCTFLVPHGFL